MAIRRKTFQKGAKVKIMSTRSARSYAAGFVHDMEKYLGTWALVKSLTKGGERARLDIDNGRWDWSMDMIAEYKSPAAASKTKSDPKTKSVPEKKITRVVNGHTIWPGFPVSGMINRTSVRGVLHFESSDPRASIWFCQNRKCGDGSPNKHGFKYSWVFQVDDTYGGFDQGVSIPSLAKTPTDVPSAKYKFGDTVYVKYGCAGTNSNGLAFSSVMERYEGTGMTIKSSKYVANRSQFEYRAVENDYIWCDKFFIPTPTPPKDSPTDGVIEIRYIQGVRVYDGMPISGKIRGTRVEGRLAFSKYKNKFFFCQDEFNGTSCGKLHGYKYSWDFKIIGNPEDPCSLLTDDVMLELKEKLTETPMKEDIRIQLPDGTTLYHGMEISGTIERKAVSGKLYIVPTGMMFFCQNEKNGNTAPDRLGYAFSWSFEVNSTNDGFTSSVALDNCFKSVTKDVKKDEARPMGGVCTRHPEPSVTLRARRTLKSISFTD